MNKYIVRLTEAEETSLKKLVKTGKASAYPLRRANILLKADITGPAWTDARIGEVFSVHPITVAAMRKRFVEQGFEMALDRKRRAIPPRQTSFDGEAEARLIALSCSEPPEGYSRWTLRLLADKAVELAVVPKVSHETVRKTLEKMN